MKRIYILLLVATVALAGSAQKLQKSPKLAFTPKEAVKSEMQWQSTHNVKPMTPAMNLKRLPARVNIITEQPEGELKTYERAGEAFYSFWGYLFGAYQDGAAMEIVYAADGKTVYMKDPVSQAAVGTWVQGTLSDDGKTITVPLEQYVYYYDSYGYGYVTAWVKTSLTDEGSLSTTIDDSVTEATYTINGDVISLNNTSGDFDTYECSGLGLIWDDDRSWSGYLDWNSVYTLFTDTPVALPDGVTLEDFSMTYNEDGGRGGKMIKGAIVGNDVYFTNFSANCPDGVMKGTIDGTVATFTSQQYLGVGSGMFLHMYGLTLQDENYYILDELVFDYDATTRTFTSRDILAVVAGNSIYEMYQEPIIGPYTDHAAVPADPSVLKFYDSGSASGYTYGNFNVPLEDVDGNFINPDDLYYSIYVDDDELFVFSPDEYPYITENTTELAYNFTDNYDIATGGGSIYFYETGFERIGIQSIFRGGGEEHRSNIVYMDLRATDTVGDVKQIYSSYLGDESSLGNVGTTKAEAYDVAMYVEDGSLEGIQVKGLRFRVNECNATDYAGWLSTGLSLATRDGVKRADADIAWEDVTINDGVAEVIFTEPYTIGKDGFYAGYSFIIPELSEDIDGYPLVLSSNTSNEGMWLHTSRTYRNWLDLSSKYSTTIELLLTGDKVLETAAVLLPQAEYNVKAGEPLTLNMNVVNHGTTTLNDIEYVYEINGMSDPVALTLDEPLAGDYYGRSTEVSIELPAINEAGDYKLYLNTTKANGVENLDITAEQYATVHVYDKLPVKRPLIEEYTGTWCGWCTRGLMAMRELAKIYGDDFMGVAYHNSDPMEIMSSYYYPSTVSGFPAAWVDRVHDVDPFYGYERNSLGITEVIDYQANQLAKADVDVYANWTDESKTRLNVTVKSEFIANDNGNNYSVEVMLLEDDMYGEAGSDWDQSNYYPNYADSYASDPYLSEVCSWPSTIEGYHFNDVLVFTTSAQSGVYPDEIVKGEVYAYDQAIYPDELINTDGEAIVQDKSKLTVLAVIIDATTGAVVNCNKVSDFGVSAINDVFDGNKQIESTRYFDLQGREVQNPVGGIYIKCIRYTDGTSANVKVLKK